MDIQTKVGIIVTNSDSLLLIKEKLDYNNRSLWNIVKGSYEGGESIEEATIRECHEEASLEVDLLGSLGVYVSQADGKVRVQFNFLARAKNGKARIAAQEEQKERGEEISEARWFSREDAAKLNPEDFVTNRAYQLVQDYLQGHMFPLGVCKSVGM